MGGSQGGTAIAIVWPCGVDVERYAGAGRKVAAPRRPCPHCGLPMIFWSGYRRFVRSQGRTWRIWIHRSCCRPCRRSHALVPAFLLVHRLDPAAVIGAALVAGVGGAGMRTAAFSLGVPHTTARDWYRRYRARAPALAAGFAALAVTLGGPAPFLAFRPEAAALEALAAAWSQARRRLGASVLAPFCFASAVSGGAMLATTTTPPWAGRLGSAWIPPVPTT